MEAAQEGQGELLIGWSKLTRLEDKPLWVQHWLGKQYQNCTGLLRTKTSKAAE